MPKPVQRTPDAKKVKQPTITKNPVVKEIKTVGGNKIDLCAFCSHMLSKVITNLTTCTCCKKGHTGL